ncbi:MAG: hypothetical protein ACI4TZ_03985 [Christensenellales bacterium]
MGKALKGLIITIVSIIALVSVSIIGGYIFVRSKYNIDLFRTVGQLKTLTQSVDESTLCPNAFKDEDFTSLQTSLNSQLADGVVKYAEGDGYNGYSVDFTALSGVTLPHTSSIGLTEKQTGALAQIIFYEQTSGKIQVGETQLEIEIVQMDFSDIDSNGSADFNVVVKIDLTTLKADMTSFPFSWLKKYIPDGLYISSTVRVDKTDNLMGYSVAHKQLTINNLSVDDTTDLFNTLDTVLKIGSAEALNTSIGTTVANALIGNGDNAGFAYSLKAIGKTSCSFMTAGSVDYFVIN